MAALRRQKKAILCETSNHTREFSANARLVTVFVFLISVCIGSTAHSQNRTWNPFFGSTNYHSAGNWLPLDVPNSVSERAVIDGGLTGADPVLSQNVTVGGLRIEQDGQLNTLGHTLTVLPGPGLTGLTDIRSPGILRIDSTGNDGGSLHTTDLRVIGDLFIDGNSSVRVDEVTEVQSGGFIDVRNQLEARQTLTGGGAIRLFSSATKLIVAEDSSTLAGNFSGVISGAGSLEKKGPAIFTLSGSNTYTGATDILSGGLQTTGSGRLHGETVVTVSPGAFFLLGVNIADAIWGLQGGGTVDLGDNANLVIGNNGNNGGIGTFAGEIEGQGALTKRGAGTFSLASGNSYSGMTTVTDGVLRVTNSSGSATGTGDILVESGGTLSIDGGFVNAGELNNSGAIDMTSGSLDLDLLQLDGGIFDVSGGRLVAGTVVGDLTVAGGTLAIGNSPGEMLVQGNYSQLAGATLEIEISGTQPGTGFDQMTATGDVSLAGSLSVQLLSPFVLSDGQQFTIISTSGNLIGQFDGLADGELVGVFGGVALLISYESNSVNLFAFAGKSETTGTIDFQALQHLDDQIASHGNVYNEEGFTLTCSDFEFMSLGTFASGNSGSTALHTLSNQTTILSKDDGAAFAIESITLSELADSQSATVTFTGNLAEGATTTQSFTLDGNSFEPEQFDFNSEFEYVTSVSWAHDTPGHQFDNIVLADPVIPGILTETRTDTDDIVIPTFDSSLGELNSVTLEIELLAGSTTTTQPGSHNHGSTVVTSTNTISSFSSNLSFNSFSFFTLQAGRQHSFVTPVYSGSGIEIGTFSGVTNTGGFHVHSCQVTSLGTVPAGTNQWRIRANISTNTSGEPSHSFSAITRSMIFDQQAELQSFLDGSDIVVPADNFSTNSAGNHNHLVPGFSRLIDVPFPESDQPAFFSGSQTNSGGDHTHMINPRFTVTATFDFTPVGDVLLGDVNLDGIVNLVDVNPFVERLSTGQYQAEADTNEDGIVNLLDVNSFVGLLSGN